MSSIDNSSPEIHVHNPKNKIKESTGYKVFTVFNTIIMILVSFATLYPFLYLVSQSFSSEQAIIAGHTSLIPEGFNINTYIYVITRYDCEFLKYYLNTIIYTVVGTVLSLLFSSVLAYPLSKPKLRINKFLSPFIIFTMYFGGGLIANYVLVLRLGLKEAGEIDGLNKFGVFWNIAIPLSKPIIATMTLFYAVMYWNNWFNAKLYLQDKAKWPVAYFLQTIIRGAGASDPDATQMSANIKSCAMVLTVLPIICVYPVIQKYYVQGMMLGGVKE